MVALAVHTFAWKGREVARAFDGKKERRCRMHFLFPCFWHVILTSSTWTPDYENTVRWVMSRNLPALWCTPTSRFGLSIALPAASSSSDSSAEYNISSVASHRLVPSWLVGFIRKNALPDSCDNCPGCDAFCKWWGYNNIHVNGFWFFFGQSDVCGLMRGWKGSIWLINILRRERMLVVLVS